LLPSLKSSDKTEAKVSGSYNVDGTRAGRLIINADDWGRDFETTQSIKECTDRDTVSSVSAMVFMADSARAADVAKEQGIDAGLHLNLTTPFTSADCPREVASKQERIVRHLRGSRFARAIFNPLLMHEFEYVVAAQIDEYRRLYGAEPVRIDGHHHMHLCANVLFGRLLPSGTVVRRNFSFESGEKNLFNRSYRSVVDRTLARRHRLTDYFYSLPPIEPPARLEKIFSLSRKFVVEVETHPVNAEEHRFLMGEELLRLVANTRIATSFKIPGEECAKRSDARRS
jgi:chitin disaccharide deacetylase